MIGKQKQDIDRTTYQKKAQAKKVEVMGQVLSCTGLTQVKIALAGDHVSPVVGKSLCACDLRKGTNFS